MTGQAKRGFWSYTTDEILKELGTSREGLSEAEAERRLKEHGPNILHPRKRTDALTILIGQFKSPIILLLLFAAVLSFYLGDATDSVIILIIVLASGLLGFWQEYEANSGEYDDSGNGGEDMRDCRDEFLAALTLDESDPSLLPEDVGVPAGTAWQDSVTGYWLLREWPSSAPLAARCGVS